MGLMKKTVLFYLICVLTGCAGLFAEAEDPLTSILNSDALGAWKRAEPADVYNKDNVFELIDGEAELYFPYGLKRVVAAEYAQEADPENTISIEVYELASLLDAFGVFSNYRDEESKPAQIGAEAVAGSTQVMFYQDVFFVKARSSKTDQKEKLLQFAADLSKTLPQRLDPPSEPAVLDVKGVIPATRQYIGQSLLGYDFFKKGLLAKAFLEDTPPPDAKPLRVFVIHEDSAKDAEAVIQKYVEYLNQNGAKSESLPADGESKFLKAADPLHKGVLLKQKGAYIIGVAKLTPEADAKPLIDRIEAKLPK